ncbi:MAG TPA: hypothetical protein VID47_11475 [Actinomycetota bacterium]
MERDRIAELLRTTPPGLPPGRPDVGEVVRRRRRRRVASVIAVGLLVAVATGVPLVVLSSLAGNRARPPVPGESSAPSTPSPTFSSSPGPSSPVTTTPEEPVNTPIRIPGGRTISSNGLSVDVPPGWFDAIWPIQGVGDFLVATIHVPQDHSFPGVEARSSMGDDGVLISIQENTRMDPCDAYPTPRLPVAFRPEDFAPGPPGEELPPGHSWAGRTFAFADRCFQVEAEFGSDPATPPSLSMANAVLASLGVAPSGPQPSPVASPPVGSETGTVGWIVCGEHGAEVRTPHVIAQADGFHFRVDNLVKDDLVVFDGPGNPGFDIDGVTRKDAAESIAPGATSVACASSVAGKGIVIDRIPPSAYVPISLDDPAGLWHDASLSCDSSESFLTIGNGPFPTVEPLIEAVRGAISGLQPGDVLTYGEFPEQKGFLEVSVIRDGKNVAFIRAFGADTEEHPFTLMEACPDSGLSDAPRH